MVENTLQNNLNHSERIWIKREITTPYNHQQNGIAERKSGTIMEAVKTMIP